jgi:hypothetical protein
LFAEGFKLAISVHKLKGYSHSKRFLFIELEIES